MSTLLFSDEYDRRYLVKSHLKLYEKYGPIVRQKYGPINIIQLFDVRVRIKVKVYSHSIDFKL